MAHDIRLDHRVIRDIITPRASILDLGCERGKIQIISHLCRGNDIFDLEGILWSDLHIKITCKLRGFFRVFYSLAEDWSPNVTGFIYYIRTGTGVYKKASL